MSVAYESITSLVQLAVRVGIDPNLAAAFVESVRSQAHLNRDEPPADEDFVGIWLDLSDDLAWQPQQRIRFVTGMVGGVRRAAAMLDVDPAQPSRWASGATVPAPDQARALIDLDHVLAHAALVWPHQEVISDWLNTANAHLDGLRPIEWIRRHGSAEVVDALEAEAAGAYA
jgi:Antitoxin Xre/MbcA/ParS C-terminal toxin-binding domain